MKRLACLLLVACGPKPAPSGVTPNDAIVYLKSNVGDANVYVDGRFVGPIGVLRGGIAVDPGKHQVAVDVILIGCIPLAGMTAYLASRRITRSVPVRIWAAAAYALLPVGMGAVAAGRLGTALVLVLLPLIAVVAARVFTHGRRRARRAAFAAGLLVAVAAAFVPLVWLITVAAMAIGALVHLHLSDRLAARGG